MEWDWSNGMEREASLAPRKQEVCVAEVPFWTVWDLEREKEERV